MRTIRHVARILLFPVVIAVRAMRAYRYMNNWKKFVVGGYVTVCPQVPQGLFTIDIRSALAGIMFTGSYEKDTMLQLSSLEPKSGLIVNIGANIGLYAVALARAFPSNPILAIEPNPEAYELLKQNIAQNNLADRIRTVRACISASRRKVSLSTIPGEPEYSSMDGIIPIFASSKEVRVLEVDSLRLSDVTAAEKIALIVMDVEGAEQLVLDGARDIIARDRPLIMCECADVLLNKFSSSSARLIGLLENLQYEVRAINHSKRAVKAPYEGNIFAVPRPEDRQNAPQSWAG